MPQQPNNTAAYESIVKAIDAMREANKIASDSPIPSERWNDYGRILELQERIRMALKPKDAPKEERAGLAKS